MSQIGSFPDFRGENKKYVKPPLSKASNYNHFSTTSNQESLKAGWTELLPDTHLKNHFFWRSWELSSGRFFLVEVHIYIFYILFHLWKFVATVHPRIHEKVNSLSAHVFPRNLHAVCGGTPAEKTEVSTAGKMPSSSSKRQASKGQGAEQIHHANSSCIWVFPKMVGFPHKPMGFSY